MVNISRITNAIPNKYLNYFIYESNKGNYQKAHINSKSSHQIKDNLDEIKERTNKFIEFSTVNETDLDNQNEMLPFNEEKTSLTSQKLTQKLENEIQLCEINNYNQKSNILTNNHFTFNHCLSIISNSNLLKR